MKNLYAISKLTMPVIILCILLVSSCKKEEDNSSQPATANVPTLSTLPITEISDKSVKVGVTISDNGGATITERGVCYSTLPNPNINNSIEKSGTGVGSFEVTIQGLDRGKKYYVRAYAKNNAGVGYGNELEFTTLNLESLQVNGYTLYIHPTNSGNIAWGKDNETTGAFNQNDGRANTDIISQLIGNYAAKVCDNLVSEGFSDWYLPAKTEMEAIKQNASNLSTVPSGAYWTSTEATAKTAFWVTFVSGPPPSNIKTATADCRCVRRD
jgi:hypothetical protein